MENLSELTNLRTQFVIFFKKVKTLDFETIAFRIKSKLPLNFISPAQYTNIPESLPSEIPRLEMRTHDDVYHVSVSLSTISLTYNKINKNFDEEYPNLKSLLLSLSEIILEFGTINRFGYVTNQFLPHPKPSNFITEKIVNRTIKDAFESSFRLVLRSHYGNFTFNESFSFEQGEKAENGKASEPIVIITRDINTVQNDSIDFTPIMINEFIESTYKNLSGSRIREIFGV